MWRQVIAHCSGRRSAWIRCSQHLSPHLRVPTGSLLIPDSCFLPPNTLFFQRSKILSGICILQTERERVFPTDSSPSYRKISSFLSLWHFFFRCHSRGRSFNGLAARAFCGQLRTHFMQPIHFFLSVFFGSFIEIAPAGQAFAHVLHSVQRLTSTPGKRAFLLYFLYGLFPGTWISNRSKESAFLIRRFSSIPYSPMVLRSDLLGRRAPARG